MSFEGLHPEFREWITQSDGGEPIRQLTPSTARRRSNEHVRESGILDNPLPVGDVRETAVEGPEGDILVRIYFPDVSGPHPILLWLHGGGWVVGSLDGSDPACRQFCRHANVIVVSVEYRLAPDHPFPKPLEDAYCVLEWLFDNAASVGGDEEKIGVGGVSAGANLAAATALLHRDRGGSDLAVQVLGVPPTDSSCNSRSHSERAEGGDLTNADLEYLWDCYLASDIHAKNPYASPLHACDLSGLPPAIVVTGEYDPLRDDGIRYVERLKEAGVDVVHHHYEDAAHGVLGTAALVSDITPTKRAFSDLTESIRNSFGTR